MRIKFVAVVGPLTPYNSLADDAPFVCASDAQSIERGDVTGIDIFRKLGSREDKQRTLVHPVTFEPYPV
jgi:hypothetical protein